MRRRPRVRRALRWPVTVVGGVGLAVVVVSFWFDLAAYSPRVHASVFSGMLLVRVGPPTWSWQVAVVRLGAWVEYPYDWALLPDWYSFGGLWYVYLPLWPLVALAVLLAAWLWRLDRKRDPPGHCLYCGYNLTGNVSGRCPECGAEVV